MTPNEIVAMALEEVAACSCDTAEDTRWSLNQRAKALRSTPSQAAGGLELLCYVGDDSGYRPIPEAVAVIEAARIVLDWHGAAPYVALRDALAALDRRLNPKVGS